MKKTWIFIMWWFYLGFPRIHLPFEPITVARRIRRRQKSWQSNDNKKQEQALRKEMQLWPGYSRSQDGIEIVREGDVAAAVALWHGTTRSVDAPGARKVSRNRRNARFAPMPRGVYFSYATGTLFWFHKYKRRSNINCWLAVSPHMSK